MNYLLPARHIRNRLVISVTLRNYHEKCRLDESKEGRFQYMKSALKSCWASNRKINTQMIADI